MNSQLIEVYLIINHFFNSNKIEVNEILEEAVDNEYKIENKENEKVVVKNGELKGKDVKISNCKSCIIAMYLYLTNYIIYL